MESVHPTLVVIFKEAVAIPGVEKVLIGFGMVAVVLLLNVHLLVCVVFPGGTREVSVNETGASLHALDMMKPAFGAFRLS
ncbi:MAG: hypothetical protein IPM95_11055 [Sphingobacteriales bacterium]|nr:hypothetical protein [Sphingobacteriales bacterium]